MPTGFNETTDEFRAWRGNYSHIETWDVIAHSCPDFKGALSNLSLKSVPGRKVYCNYLTKDQTLWTMCLLVLQRALFMWRMYWSMNNMITSSYGNISALLALCAGNSPSPVNSPHKGQWRGAFMFSLICARISAWVNNRAAGDLRRHRAHYDVTINALSKMLSQDWQISQSQSSILIKVFC